LEPVRRVLLSKFLWVLILLVVVSVLANRWVEEEGGPREAVAQWGMWAPLAAFVLQTITSFTPVGAVFLSVVNGMLFDLWLAVAINLASGIAGGVVMYLLWRRGNHEFDIQRRMEAMPQWFRRHAGDNVWFLVALRQVPWAGGRVADLIAGAHRVPFRTQLLSLVIGYVPGSLIYALMGAGLIAL
jgi:uncharacterized membrane protein YdjX (TVP38/TMEM64 family)